jgi:hypothetical protein
MTNDKPLSAEDIASSIIKDIWEVPEPYPVNLTRVQEESERIIEAYAAQVSADKDKRIAALEALRANLRIIELLAPWNGLQLENRKLQSDNTQLKIENERLAGELENCRRGK